MLFAYTLQFLEGVLASATAGIISRVVCHPLDTCKVRSACLVWN